jgi:two-component system chemotaxis sensor kinase CheA
MADAAPHPSDYLSLFKGEAEDYLAILNKGLLSLEKNPAQPAVIDDLFRAAHTLKGALRMMGYMSIQDTAHLLEDIFGKMRSGDVSVTAVIIEQALKTLDLITAQLATLWPGKSSAGTSAPAPAPSEEYIRVPASRIDTLLNLVGELLIYKAKSSDHGGVLRNLGRQAKTFQQKLHAVGERIAPLLINSPQEAQDVMELLHQCRLDAEHWKGQAHAVEERISSKPMQLDSLMDELQFKIKQLRMLPCSTIFDGLERLVRDIAQQEKKKVSLEIEGAQTELDKKVLEGLKPCLIHLLRNAVDHGIELPETRLSQGKPEIGTIHLRARQQGSKVLIEIQDDGQGINPRKLKEAALRKKMVPEHELQQMDDLQLIDLIFAPGFSTRSIVTDISGRGVGLDVVRQEIERLKGQTLVSSEAGKGTKLTLELPLTIAILKVLVIDVRGQAFGFPAERVEEIVSVKPKEVQWLGNRMALRWRDRTLALVNTGDLLGLAPVQDREDASSPAIHVASPVVIAGYGSRRIGFQVDRVRGEEEIFLKTLESQLGRLTHISGATLLGNGEILPILNVTDMVQAAQTLPAVAAPADAGHARKEPRQILLVDDSLTSREMQRNILESHGYRVLTAVDGLDALEKLSQKPVHLVVSDVEMPRMGGFDFCRTLRQHTETKDLPVIFVTSLDKEEEKRQGIEAGGQAYITKGQFDQNQLLETIERLAG